VSLTEVAPCTLVSVALAIVLWLTTDKSVWTSNNSSSVATAALTDAAEAVDLAIVLWSTADLAVWTSRNGSDASLTSVSPHAPEAVRATHVSWFATHSWPEASWVV